MNQYVARRDAAMPQHAVGEVVWADFGNYIEGGAATRTKRRPLILLRPTQCQHAAAGLTTQSRCVINGEQRLLVPAGRSLGLLSVSYLWSSRPCYISRMLVRQHAGWVDRETVFFLREAMPGVVDRNIFAALWQAAVEHEEGHA